jgi:hypothetical protein
MAEAQGFGSTVSSMIREPRVQTKRVRKARARSVCLDHSPYNIRVKRSWDTVSRASAMATQLPEVVK